MAAGIKFDYDVTKAQYLSLVRKLFDEDSTHSSRTISRTIKTLKGTAKTHLHKNYAVSRSFGRSILIEKKNDEEVQVLSFEDVFDIFIKYHIINHSGGRLHLLQLEKQLKCSYNYPSVCLSLIVKSCNVCKSALEIPTSPTQIGYVYVTVMIQNRINPVFKYLLIYLDKTTDFVLLRPLNRKVETEIAMEIFKILVTFGPPQKLCLHGYNLDFDKRVGMILRQVCPHFHFSIEYRSINLDPSALVVSKLQQWMAMNFSMWEVGCSFVQKELNLSLERIGDKKVSPHELLYGPSTSRPLNTTIIEDDEDLPLIALKEKNEKTDDKKNDEVVELRIPSPDHFETDLLSHFDSDSQELIIPRKETNEQEIEDIQSMVTCNDPLDINITPSNNQDKEAKRKKQVKSYEGIHQSIIDDDMAQDREEGKQDLRKRISRNDSNDEYVIDESFCT